MNFVNLDSAAFVADSELVEALCARAEPVDCSQPRVLFRQGDAATGLYVLRSGGAAFTLTGVTGDEVLTFAALPGSLLGLPGLVGNSGYTMSAEAKAGADVMFVSRELFSELMLTQPGLNMMILRVLAAEVRTARLAIVGK